MAPPADRGRCLRSAASDASARWTGYTATRASAARCQLLPSGVRRRHLSLRVRHTQFSACTGASAQDASRGYGGDIAIYGGEALTSQTGESESGPSRARPQAGHGRGVLRARPWVAAAGGLARRIRGGGDGACEKRRRQHCRGARPRDRAQSRAHQRQHHRAHAASWQHRARQLPGRRCELAEDPGPPDKVRPREVRVGASRQGDRWVVAALRAEAVHPAPRAPAVGAAGRAEHGER